MNKNDLIRWQYEEEFEKQNEARIINLEENDNEYDSNDQIRINKQERKIRNRYIGQNLFNYTSICREPIKTGKCDLSAIKDNRDVFIELKERSEAYPMHQYSGSTMIEKKMVDVFMWMNVDFPLSTCLFVNYYGDSDVNYIEYNITNRLKDHINYPLLVQHSNLDSSTYRSDSYQKNKAVVFLKFEEKYGDKLILNNESQIIN